MLDNYTKFTLLVYAVDLRVTPTTNYLRILASDKSTGVKYQQIF